MRGQKRDGFGVGLGVKADPVTGQFLAQFAVVLDDAVVDDRDFARLMGVGVGHRGRAMGGPAGMPDAGFARQRLMHQKIGQVDQFADRTATVQHAVVNGGNTGTVIAAIFEAFERFNKDGGGFVSPQNSDNTAH